MTTTRSVADTYLARLAPHEPAAAQALGRDAGTELADLSPEWAEARLDVDARTAAELRSLAAHDVDDTALHRALSERLESDRVLFETGFTPRLLAPLATPIHLVRESFDDAVLTDDDNGDALVERLSRVPETVHELQRRLRWAAENEDRFTGSGVAAARQVETVASQVDEWIAPGGLDFFRSLSRSQTVHGERGRRFARAADAATDAFGSFAAFLRQDLRPLAPVTDAVGETVYGATARSFLGTPLDLDEIYAFGWDELVRLADEADELARRITGRADASAGAAATVLDARTTGRLRGAAEIRTWLESRLDRTLDRLTGAFDLPASIRDVDCVVTEAASGVVYYTPGAPDGSRRSRIVWTVPRGRHSISGWREVTSFHHEGAPGHHLEHTVNRANTRLHPWQRYLCEIHGYAEGWAHYAEGVADELGLIQDDAERLGMVLGMIWRSVRIVADIGLHTGRPVPANRFTTERVWTVDVARTLLQRAALLDPHTARFEVDRYLGWPGQALAFKVGAKLWTDARRARERQRGEAFTLPDFHRDALALGPMGLGPLRDLLLSDTTPEDRT